MTLINTKYQMEARSGRRKRKPIDASLIFDLMGDFDFGWVPITSIHISTLNKVNQDGYYLPTCVVPLT
jgi:hypothetical protein